MVSEALKEYIIAHLWTKRNITENLSGLGGVSQRFFMIDIQSNGIY